MEPVGDEVFSLIGGNCNDKAQAPSAFFWLFLRSWADFCRFRSLSFWQNNNFGWKNRALLESYEKNLLEFTIAELLSGRALPVGKCSSEFGGSMKNMRPIIFNILWGALFIQAVSMSVAMAWGTLGHQSVALIAEAYLRPEIKEKVTQILRGKRLADVAMDADLLRDRPEFAPTKDYHFQNLDFYFLEPYKKQVMLDRSQGKKYKIGAVEAILKAQSDLASPRANEKDRELALKFLTHFVADLHQPMHTGLKSQYGGNGLDIRWDGNSKNLHQVWDSEIISDDLQDKIPTRTAQAWKYARVVIAEEHATVSELGLNPEDWFLESLTIQKQAIQTYKGKSQLAYQKWATPIVERRIYLAGRRLAEVINKSLSSDAGKISDFEKLRSWLSDQMRDWSGRIQWTRNMSY